MTARTQNLISKNIIRPPTFLKGSIQYEVITGSVAYGVSNSTSDHDIAGFCIPPAYILFPHTVGIIQGFDKNYERFEQYQQHHILYNNENYDITIYNIVKFFRLCADGNPNMVDLLFTPRRCVTFSTPIGEIVRSNRHLFLSKKCWHTYKGYAYSQLSKMKKKKKISTDQPSNRDADIKKHGYSTKFAYHLVRLLNQVEQILTEHTLNLERNREQLKSIRRGEWVEEELQQYFTKKESELESVYLNSTLRHAPDYERIKQVLLNCLEHYFGSIDKLVKKSRSVGGLISELKELISKYE